MDLSKSKIAEKTALRLSNVLHTKTDLQFTLQLNLVPGIMRYVYFDGDGITQSARLEVQ